MQLLMTTCLNSPVSVSAAPFFFQNLQKGKKNKTQREKEKALCVIVRDLRGGGGGSSCDMSSSENALLSGQEDRLFPYIDQPAIILSSNVLNNRALSEMAIYGQTER